MEINCLKLHQVKLPLKSPWETGYGIENSTESLLIKAFSDEAEAWVETCPLGLPLYLPETATSAYDIISSFLAPLVLGKNLENENSIADLLKICRGNSFAKAGIEQCWWALESVRTSQPLHRLLGGISKPIELSTGMGIQKSVTELIEKIKQVLDKGIRRIKLKICKGWDFQIIEEVMSCFPKTPIMVDANGGYSIEDMEFFKRIDQYGLEMIEQPFHFRDLLDHSNLQRQLQTPICLDESITCFHDADQALRLKSCKIMNIKICRVGGLSEALSIHNLCQKYGVPCWVGSMLESEIGAAINLEFSTLPNCCLPSEISVSDKFHSLNLVDPPIIPNSQGTLSPSNLPFLGKSVKEEVIHERSIRSIELIPKRIFF